MPFPIGELEAFSVLGEPFTGLFFSVLNFLIIFYFMEYNGYNDILLGKYFDKVKNTTEKSFFFRMLFPFIFLLMLYSIIFGFLYVNDDYLIIFYFDKILNNHLPGVLFFFISILLIFKLLLNFFDIKLNFLISSGEAHKEMFSLILFVFFIVFFIFPPHTFLGKIFSYISILVILFFLIFIDVNFLIKEKFFLFLYLVYGLYCFSIFSLFVSSHNIEPLTNLKEAYLLYVNNSTITCVNVSGSFKPFLSFRVSNYYDKPVRIKDVKIFESSKSLLKGVNIKGADVVIMPNNITDVYVDVSEFENKKYKFVILTSEGIAEFSHDINSSVCFALN